MLAFVVYENYLARQFVFSIAPLGKLDITFVVID
jgi:hypothetical protein